MSTIHVPDVVRDAEPMMQFHVCVWDDETMDDEPIDCVDYDVYADGDGGYWIGWSSDAVGLVRWEHRRDAGETMLYIPDAADRVDENPLNILP